MQNANVNANARCVMCLDDLCGELIGPGRWARMRVVWKDAASSADVPPTGPGTSNPSSVGPDVSQQRSEAGASASASASASGPRCAFYPWICNTVHPWQTTLDLYIDRVTSHAWLVPPLHSRASEGSTAEQRDTVLETERMEDTRGGGNAGKGRAADKDGGMEPDQVAMSSHCLEYGQRIDRLLRDVAPSCDGTLEVAANSRQ